MNKSCNEKTKPRLAASCTGCGACENACSKGAISMVMDPNGFYKPSVDLSLCVQCGKCTKTCPELNYPAAVQGLHYAPPRVFSGWATNDNIRMRSSSGGIFPVLAEFILKRGGVVYGAGWDEEMIGSVRHTRIEKLGDLPRLTGSKYLQSSTEGIFRLVKEDLKNNRDVLFVGTPCQTAGLQSFIRNDDQHLFLVDVACHGVPSRKIYDAYVRNSEKPVHHVDFRNKCKGWSPYHLIKWYSDETHSKPVDMREDLFMDAFLCDLGINDSCYHCRYVLPPRSSDITLADFWGAQLIHPRWNDNKGISLILANSEKGEALLNTCKCDLALFPEEWEKVRDLNMGLWRSPYSVSAVGRRQFMKDLDEMSLAQVIKKHTSERKPKYDVALLGKWWSCNYGAVYTSYALYCLVESLGLRAALIDQAPWYDLPTKGNVFRDFVQEEGLARIFAPQNNTYSLNKFADTFLVGSDLVWSHDYLDQFYFLDFALGCKRKVSYSSSMSTYTTPKRSYRKRVTKLLRRFDAVSFREKHMLPFFKDTFDCHGQWVLDPVFLLSQSHWKQLADKTKSPESPYIAAYILDPSPEKKELLQSISERKGLPVRIITDANADKSKFGHMTNATFIDNASLYEWLNSLFYCNYFITDSYHGLCFALIFNKQFACINNKSRGSRRFESLLDMSKLRHRLIDCTSSNVDSIVDNILYPINFAPINLLLSRRIERSKKWLINALTGERSSSVMDYNERADRLVKKPSAFRDIYQKVRGKLSRYYRRIKSRK